MKLNIPCIYLIHCLSSFPVSKCIAVIQENLHHGSALNIVSKYLSLLNQSMFDSDGIEETEWRKFVDISLMLMGFPERLRKSIVEVKNILTLFPALVCFSSVMKITDRNFSNMSTLSFKSFYIDHVYFSDFYFYHFASSPKMQLILPHWFVNVL